MSDLSNKKMKKLLRILEKLKYYPATITESEAANEIISLVQQDYEARVIEAVDKQIMKYSNFEENRYVNYGIRKAIQAIKALRGDSNE